MIIYNEVVRGSFLSTWKFKKIFESSRAEVRKEKTLCEEDPCSTCKSGAHCLRCVYTVGGGGMPAKACVIGRFGYEDKYRDEPSFVIATFMRQRARRDVHAPPLPPPRLSMCWECKVREWTVHVQIAVRLTAVMKVVACREVVLYEWLSVGFGHGLF